MKRRAFVVGMVAVAALPMVPMRTTFAQSQGNTTTYRSKLMALNAGVTGTEATGEVELSISGDDLSIHIAVQGVPPGMMHLQHFHGFPEPGKAAICATMEQDANGDGIIDLIETESVSGTTMVPFHDDPVSMEVVNDTYPKSDASGAYTYDKTVSLKALEAAFAKAFPETNGKLDLATRVIYIHGIPDSQELPDTVASLGDIPAQVTIPIACGQLELVGAGTPSASPADASEATPAG
jgi:hypothetical protein